MRHTEKLEALEFAIACVIAVHDGIVKRGGSQMNHQDSSVKCDCNYGATIRCLRDEACTVRCAIEAVQLRKKVFSAAKLHGSGAPVKVVTS